MVSVVKVQTSELCSQEDQVWVGVLDFEIGSFAWVGCLHTLKGARVECWKSPQQASEEKRFHHTHPCTIHKEELEAFSQTEHSRAQTKNHDVHTRWAPFLKGNHYLVEKGMVTHSSTLAWRTLWTDEAGGLWSTGSQRVGHDWSSWAPSLSWLLALLVLNLMYMDSQSVYSGVWFLSRCVCVWSRHAFTLTLHSSPSSAYTTHLSVHPPADGNWIVSSFSATFNSVATNTLIQFPSNTCVHFC